MKDKEKIFLDLISNHSDRIYRLIWSFTHVKADCEDLYQNVLLKVWRGLESFNSQSLATTWIYRITLNSCIDYSRRISRNNLLLTGHDEILHIQGDTDIEEDLIRNEKLTVLYKCLQSLSTIEKSLISLYLEDLKHKEIAVILGITEKNVAVKLTRLKKKINKMIREDGNY